MDAIRNTAPYAPGCFDGDVHAVVPSAAVLLPYLSAHWREVIAQSGFRGPVDDAYPVQMPTSAHPAERVPGGPVPGSDPARLRAHLDAWGTRRAIVSCTYSVDSLHNPDAAVALARAVNDWLLEHWLGPEPRLRGSVTVTPQQPEAAAREIERVGGRPELVQVLLPARSEAPYGQRRYWPIFEAALKHDLVVAIHFGGAPGVPPTPVGWPATYLEEYAGMAHVCQSQLISLVCEGVFDRFPELRVVIAEGGFTWLPSTLWRLDKDWKGIRREVPWVRRLPSEYVREHVRFTVQPLDAPAEPRHLHQLLDQLGADDLLLFATDWPHWHFDTPAEALPPDLPPALRRRIMVDNPAAFYRLT